MPEPPAAPSARPKISAIVTTFNEEHNIAACLDSLAWCDEVLVVDSFSTDRTKEIVAGYGEVRFLERTYYGSAAQKNWAIDRTAHDWILIFDADERCPEPLRHEIESLLAHGPEQDCYSVRRRLFFLEQRIRYCGFQNDTVVRLFRRGAARYPNRRVHANMITKGPAPVLREPLDHFMVYDPAEYVRRITKYGIWGASQAYREGRRAGIKEFIGRPLWRLFRAYVLQLGFLDGRLGMIFCLIQAYGTFVKWSMLFCWRIVERLGREPDLPPVDDDQETWAGLDQLAPQQSAGAEP